MGRPKGGTNKYWSKEAKLVIIKRVIEDHESTNQVSNSENISNGMLNNWLKKYYESGEAGLESQRNKPCLMKHYAKSKKLSDLERLEYENLTLRIENERLKKGYIVKGVGKNKEYVSTNKRNLK
jgi:transposase-like protein